MRYYCPSCWADFDDNASLCPRCGADLQRFFDGKDYVDKLIVALEHPEPETPIRAAWILGKRREIRAVEPLIAVVNKTRDVYTARAAVEALDRIGTSRAREFLRVVADTHPADMVRSRARTALLNEPDDAPATPEGDITG